LVEVLRTPHRNNVPCCETVIDVNAEWDSIKCGEHLDWLKTVQLLKKDCAAWSE